MVDVAFPATERRTVTRYAVTIQRPFSWAKVSSVWRLIVSLPEKNVA